jgi:hypothetical protein
LAEDSWPPSKTAEEKREKRGRRGEEKADVAAAHCITIDDRGLHRR